MDVEDCIRVKEYCQVKKEISQGFVKVNSN